MPNELFLFWISLPLIAFLYASVGHGGASGYLALMALFSFLPEQMKPTALLLNLFVAGVSFYHYWRTGHFGWARFWPFAIASIPMAFAGGMLEVDAKLYRQILAVLLLVAVGRMLYQPVAQGPSQPASKPMSLLTGGGIGFFSGLIGIGGGIVLSPLMVVMKWGNMKEAAAVAALFIWVNSIAGLAGQFTQGAVIAPQAWLMVGIAAIAGFFGGQLGSKRFNNRILRILLAIVLLMASAKLLTATQ